MAKKLIVMMAALFLLLNVSGMQAQEVRIVSPTPTPLSALFIDNPSASVTGTWNTESTLAGKYNTNYLIKTGGAGSAKVVFSPNFPASGRYIVREWHPASSSNTSTAKLTVNYLGGSSTSDINQQINGGQWNTIGTFDFGADSAYNVTITDQAAVDKNVVADAIGFLYSSAIPTFTATPTPTVIPPTPTTTATSTSIPPTSTPTPTSTSVSPTSTPTPTSIPPTYTPTPTPISPTSTPTPTSIPPTPTPTSIPPTPTPTTPTPTPPTPTVTPTLTVTPAPTGTPTQTPTPTPSPTPTPVEPCPPLPPDESPQLINRTPGDGIISEILFNEENHHIYINARNRSWIDWVSYDDIKNTPSGTEVPLKGGRGYLGHYISISPTGKLRYVAINQRSSTDPVVGLFRCKGDGDLQVLASSVTSKSALLPNWTYNFIMAGFQGFISGTRKGCVSPHPPTVYIPSDGSCVRHIPTGVPYTIYSRLFAFMNGLDVQDFHPIQAVFEPAKDESPWHLNGSSMAIGDIFYGCNKVFVPFEDLNAGRLLVGTPKSDGYIPFQTKNIGSRNTGLEEVIFYDDQGQPLATPVNFKYSEMVFHPTENIAFIADARDSGIYLVNLDDMDTVFLRYRATKYVHPKSVTINNDETRMIAITGDGQYVMCKSAYQNGYKGAIFPFKLDHDMQGLPYLEPVSAIKPVGDYTFSRVTKFAAGARTSVYVINDTTNELWYYRISDDKDVVTTSPLKKITVPSGILSSIYTDNNREMLAVRSGGATADGDAAYFFKINNWYYKFEYLKPKRLPNSTCRFCEPMLPLGGPVEVRVKITDFSGKVISKTDADVTCYYIITGPDGTFQSEEKPMDDMGGGEFSTKIHPPHPGDIEIICKATPKGKAVSDNASLFACVSDKSAPTITCDVIPKNVIIPYWLDKPGGGRAYYVCKVKGTVQWGAGSDYPTKIVTVYETKNPSIYKQVTCLNLDTENDFEVSFELMKGEFPYFDQPIEFNLTAVAEKSLGDTIGSGLVHFVPSPQICVVSLDKYNTTQYGKYFEIKSVLYDAYISYKWTINLPPWADKFDFTFKGKDLKILGCEIPVINEVEINFTTSLKLVHAAFSDYRSPVVCESSGGVSGSATIPYGIGKFNGQLSANVKGTGYYKPDCDLMAFPVGTPKVEISGGGELGGEISVLTLLKKLRTLEKVAKSDVFKNFLKWLGNMLENPAYARVMKFLEECAAVSVSLVVECTLKGDMVADPASPIYVRLTNFSGEFRKSLKPSISISLDRWFKLSIDFIIGVVSDPADLTFSMASIATWTPGKITSGFIIIKGGWKAGIVSGDITKTNWVEVYYPEKPSGGVAPPQLAAVPDFLRADYNLLAVKPRARINADDTPTTIVNNIYLFSTPFQIVQGTKRMIIYLHRRPDLPFERSTEIYYLYIDNDVLMSYGPVWEDTRFQDYPTAVFTADGNVLLACQSMKIDDFTAPDTSDVIASNNASAPYQEIAWALFNTTSLQWSAPVYLTNDDKEDFEPRLFIDHKNKPILLFQTSSSAGCFYTSENTKCALKFSRFDSGNFSAPQILVDNIGVPIRLDCHGYSDKTWLVYSRDQDDDALTTPDTQLYALSYTGTPQAWDATPTQLTSGAAYNDTPRLLADEQGGVRLIWQHNNEVWSSVGEPLAQNPQVLLKGETLSRTQVSHFIQLLNGDIASLTSGYIGDKSNPGSFIYQPFYDYVDPTTGTLGTEGAGGGADGSTYQFLVDAVGLPNEKVSALFFRRQITYSLDDINPSLDVGTASLMLYNFLPSPPEDYKIGIAVQCPQRAKPGDTIYVNLIPNRRMKVYSSDFKITVDERLTIKDVQLAAGMGSVTIAPDKMSATIIRSGAYPVGFFLENTTLATLTVEVSENASADTKHIFLTDLDSMGDFMTTESMGMKFTSEPASLDIIFPASWYVRGD